MSVGELTVRAEYLDEATIAALLARRQAAYADAAQASGEAQIAFLLWSLGEERYATPLADVREVAPVPRAAPVPGAPARLLGVVAWRGIIHNLFDPAQVLGSGGGDAGGYMLVLRHDRPRIALRVSAISAASAPLPPEDGALTRFVESADGTRFALVSTSLLIEQLLARPGAREG